MILRLRRSCRCRLLESRRRGIVLILVMVVVVMISLAGFSFVASMSNENRAVHLRGEQLQMEYAIASAEEFLKQYLVRPSTVNPSQPADQLSDEAMMRGIVVSDEDGPHTRVRFTIMAPDYDVSITDRWKYGMQRESARLDLHIIMERERVQPGNGRKVLLSLPGMTEPTADALLDWMDTDNTPRPSGAEENYYAGLNPSYRPRNGIPDCLEEFLLVKGVTRSLLFGSDANQNHHLDPEEQMSVRAARSRDNVVEGQLPWVELLTLYSGERNQTRDGQPRINLNQRDLAQLHRQLTEAFDATLATFAVSMRQYGASSGSGSVADVKTIKPNLTIPARWLFSSPLDLLQSQVQIAEPGGVVRVVRSPVPTEREKLDQFLGQLCDRTTTSEQAVIRGRLNINLAPKELLQEIPGIDKALAEQIAASRSSTAKRERPREQHACWPLTEGLVNLNTMKQLFPFVTTGGDVYRAQIVAFSEASRLSQRVEVVIDASGKSARRVFWKDLQVLGRGYPWDVLDTPGGIPFTRPGAFDETPTGN